ncbi:DUF1656 domain-containing protein [Methylovirgula sp. 4M-Z18]|uniref:DUF1656 domain-containing protein n=1 Tax=Methylovirgula sp. 4M-Z18 TaxID=2293567 RepID=UPI000E2EF29F|nr:DUF1656 domain-containing protein [Methylovirgula sp. 4M-Z18]RFB79275.1 DUF1656 domain-containing protein [Methylovirgula sp. 4M-Z18]
MTYEIDLFGIVVPALLVWAIVAYVLCALLRRALEGFGFYRHVWHRPLFDFASFVVLLTLLVAVSARFVA